MMSFSTSNPNLQIAWDATSLAAFRRCPRYYQLSILEGWRTKFENDDITFGSLYHEALEKYDKARGNGISYSDALRLSVRHALVASGTRDASGVFHPWATDNPNKNRFTLIRSIVWYLCQFKDDVFETLKLPDGRAAVELSFRIPLPLMAYTGEPYVLCGHLDRVVKDDPHAQVIDRKTTKTSLTTRYFERYNPDTQFTCYSVATRVMFGTEEVRLVIDAVQLAVNFSRFMRGSTGRTKAQMDEWINDTLYWIQQAEACAKKGYYPMNDQACGLYGKCTYRDSVCSLDPAARSTFLKGKFEQKDRWDPLKIRGE